MDDWIDLLATPLPTADAIDSVSRPQAGGVAVFLGVTRAETNAQGQTLLALDYEAYAVLAMRQLKALATDANERWPILRLAILHRTGRVEVGQPSVLIA